MRPITVLHTESSLGWGGQENRTLNEMLTLREMGHRCLLACQPGAKLGIRAGEAGFPVSEIRMRGLLDLPGIAVLRGLMRREMVDIVNTHSGRDTQLGGLAARSIVSGRPRIVRTRHLALPITSRFTYSVLPDHVVTVSRFVGDYLASAGVPREMITAVPTGIDLDRYQTGNERGSLREELGLPADTLLIGTVAILRKKKGHSELLEAAAIILQRFPNTHFVIAGDGPQAANLRNRVAELGLSDRVHLLGLRRDVVNILKSLDIFVLPTYQEALGTAFIEAAASGCPAIGTRVDGVPEIVCDDKTGVLVPVKDAAALAEAIAALLADPVRRQAMGRAAVEHVRSRYSCQVMVQGMLGVYAKLLKMV